MNPTQISRPNPKEVPAQENIQSKSSLKTFLKGKKAKWTILIVLSVLLIGILIGYYITWKRNTAPSKVYLTNRTDNSITVTWATNWPTRAEVRYSKDPSFKTYEVAYDERDLTPTGEYSGKQNSYTTHFVVLRNLDPSTTYYYQVVAGGEVYTKDKDGSNFPEAKTWDTFEEMGTPDPMYGKVVDKNGKPVKDAIVYVYVTKAKNGDLTDFANTIVSDTLSTLTGENGTWTIDKANLRLSNDGKRFGNVTGFDDISITVQINPHLMWNINTKGDKLSPVPTIITEEEKAEKSSWIVDTAYAMTQSECDQLLRDINTSQTECDKQARMYEKATCKEYNGEWQNEIDAARQRYNQKCNPPDNSKSEPVGGKCTTDVCQCNNQGHCGHDWCHGQGKGRKECENYDNWCREEREAKCTTKKQAKPAKKENPPTETQQPLPQLPTACVGGLISEGELPDQQGGPFCYISELKVCAVNLLPSDDHNKLNLGVNYYAKDNNGTWKKCDPGQTCREIQSSSLHGECKDSQMSTCYNELSNRYPDLFTTLTEIGFTQIVNNTNSNSNNSCEVTLAHASSQLSTVTVQENQENQKIVLVPHNIFSCTDGTMIKGSIENVNTLAQNLKKDNGAWCLYNDMQRKIGSAINGNTGALCNYSNIRNCSSPEYDTTVSQWFYSCDYDDYHIWEYITNYNAGFYTRSWKVQDNKNNRTCSGGSLAKNPNADTLEKLPNDSSCTGQAQPQCDFIVTAANSRIEQQNGKWQLIVYFQPTQEEENQGCNVESIIIYLNGHKLSNPSVNRPFKDYPHYKGTAEFTDQNYIENSNHIELKIEMQNGSSIQKEFTMVLQTPSHIQIPKRKEFTMVLQTPSHIQIPNEGNNTEGISKDIWNITTFAAERKDDSITVTTGTHALPAGVYKAGDLEFKVPDEGGGQGRIEIIVFEDKNGNGIMDEGESVLENTPVAVVQEKITRDINLINGWNAISFNFIPEKEDGTQMRAKDFLESVIAHGGYAITIETYDGRWINYTIRAHVENNKVVIDSYGSEADNFALQPGVGYFVRSLWNRSIPVTGQQLTDSAPVQLNNGWTLIGLAPGAVNKWSHSEFNDGITAFEFINTATNAGIETDKVTKWDYGVYKGVVRAQDENGETIDYGIDFVLEEWKAYFVHAKEKGVFVP